MKEFDLIRPKQLYEDVLKQRETDGCEFFKTYRNELIDIDCPACGKNGDSVFKKYGFTHKVCRDCDTLFCSPRPPEKLLSIYYKTYLAPQKWTKLLLQADRERKKFQVGPRVEKIVKIIRSDGIDRLAVAVDIGAGSGAFSLCLKDSGFFDDVIALDISEECVEACRNQDLKSICGTVSDLKSDFVDFMCMNDLIEHVFDPVGMLKECSRGLRKNGYLAIATPNGCGFDFNILKETTRNITPPEHLTYFNPSSLCHLLSRCGFEVLKIETPGHLDVEIVERTIKDGFTLSEKNEFLEYLFSMNEVTKKNFQTFLSDNLLSSHMFCLARKPG